LLFLPAHPKLLPNKAFQPTLQTARLNLVVSQQKNIITLFQTVLIIFNSAEKQMLQKK
jgi:hypothetical protein